MLSTFKNRRRFLLCLAVAAKQGKSVDSLLSPLHLLQSQGSIFGQGECLTHRRTTFTITNRSFELIREGVKLDAKAKRSSGGKAKRGKRKKTAEASVSSINEVKDELTTSSPTELESAVSSKSIVESASEIVDLPFDPPEFETESLFDQATAVESVEVPERSAKPSFRFERSEALALGIEDAEDDDDIPSELRAAASPAKPLEEKGALELPSMEELASRKKKQAEEDSKVVEREKIDRRNTSKFRELLEVEPNADTDTSFFVPDEYGTVSALLGEGAQSFIGLPLAILQVGHFILALGIVLMAFVEYPGFPLTNLPSQVRGALQGGLGTVYLINIVLSIFAVFEAGKRGQPKGLWAIKTFTVGGLAFDQLTQLPTKEQQNRGDNKRNRK